MKVNSQKINNNKNLNFEGYKIVKSNYGAKEYEFNYPYDSSTYDCYLEVFSLDQDENKNFHSPVILKNFENNENYYKLKPGKNRVDIYGMYGLRTDQDFAYHFVLLPKGKPFGSSDVMPIYRVDPGEVIDFNKALSHEKYNIVNASKSMGTTGGAMKLLMPDFYNALWTYDKNGKIVKNSDYAQAAKSIKTFSNKVGGNLAGIEKDVRDGKFDNYTRIISTPIFTDDSLTPHAYWNKNCMQMALSLGNINNYASLQREMFKKGINFVSDGAFVNEGLEGIHFKNVLKWGTQSPYFYWFRAEGLKSGPLTLGVFSEKSKFISHKIVNSPYEFIQNPKTGEIKIKTVPYDKNKPTYLQIFDNRLVSAEDQKDTKHLIKAYKQRNTENQLAINTHNDTVVPYSFEIDPEIYKNNIEKLNELNKKRNSDNKIKLRSYDGTRMAAKFDTFELDKKIESRFDTWDSNSDIAKLNYVFSDANTHDIKSKFSFDKQGKNTKKLEQKNFEVQDYAISSGRYWTGKTYDILNTYITQTLGVTDKNNPKKAYETILENIEKGNLPKKLKSNINLKTVENVLNGSYELNRANINVEFSDIVLSGVMNFPLDSIEFGDNLTAVLASPYISKRATSAATLGKTRYEMYNKNDPHLPDEYANIYQKMNKVYEEDIRKQAIEIINNINKMIPDDQEKIYKGYNASEYGKYILPAMCEEITKFLIIKALAPDVEMKYNKDTGEISYDYEKLKDTHLQTIGIRTSISPEDEANHVVKKIKSGLAKIPTSEKEKLADALFTQILGTNSASFRLSEMIIDRIDAGLDWRIDAAKDIGDINDLRNSHTTLDNTWQKVSNFWKTFSEQVYNQNRNAYIVAEVTDEGDLLAKGGGKNNIKYTSTEDMIKKLMRETGMTAIANYSYYFSSLMNTFGKTFEENDNGTHNGYDWGLSHRVTDKSLDFLKSGALESIIYSYNFIGNHDKPRILHGLIMDTDLFNTDVDDKNNTYYRDKACRILNEVCDETMSSLDMKKYKLKKESIDYLRLSPKALAMTEVLKDNLRPEIEKLNGLNETQRKQAATSITDALIELAHNEYLGKKYEGDGFGVKPIDVAIDIVFDQAIATHKLKHYLNDEQLQELKDNTLKRILEPAFAKLQGMMKFLVALPGLPTLYAGDDMGSTGYETKTKNIYLQNRGVLHQEWLDPKNTQYKYIQDHYAEMNKIMGLRARPELRALNDGTPYILKNQQGFVHEGGNIDIGAQLRQSTDGAMVITLFNTAGINHDYASGYKPYKVYLPSVQLNTGDMGYKKNTYKFMELSSLVKPGTIFKNAADKNDWYIVRNENGNNVLKRYVKGHDGNRYDSQIEIDDTTLILYYEPKKTEIYNSYLKNNQVIQQRLINLRNKASENGKSLNLAG